MPARYTKQSKGTSIRGCPLDFFAAVYYNEDMNYAEWNREWNRIKRRENEFLARGRVKKDSILNNLIESKVPPGLQDKLDAAFAKAFELVFEKGTGVIEKTYDREGIQRHFQNMTTNDRDNPFGSRRGLRYFAKRAGSSKKRNLMFSGASGIGLGFLGIGMPDIALFTGTMLKGLYEIALHFGYDYDSPEEKYFILKLIETSLSYGRELDDLNDHLNDWLDASQGGNSPALPEDYDQSQQIRLASAALSKELLYMKAIQMIPVAGAIGGAYDAIYMKKILRYAELKYHRRFLLDAHTGNPSDDPNSPDIA